MAATSELLRRVEAIRAELLERRAGTPTLYGFDFSEAQVQDLAAGYVPQDVQAMCRAALDWREEDERRAGRPVSKRKLRGGRG